MYQWTQHDVSDLISKEILEVGDGYRAKNTELSKNGLPFARGQNINQGFLFDDADCLDISNLERAGRKISRVGDVVFTSKGTVGRFAFVKKGTPKFVYSPQLCFWRVLNDSIICPRYLFYWMKGAEFFAQYNGVKSQTDMADYVSLTNQRQFHITLPSLAEQEAIAEILSAFDDKIELNRKINKTLEEMARALFKAWFVDFEPVHANREGRPSTSASPETAKLFPSEFENGIPKGWELCRLEDVVALLYGKSLTASNRKPGEVPVYGSNGQIGTHNKPLVEGPGIVVGRKGNPGTVEWVFHDFYPIDTTFYVKSNLELLYVYYILENLGLHNLSGDSAVPGLSRSIAYRELFLLPSKRVMEKFADFCGPISGKVSENEKEVGVLVEIRNSILPLLMSGRLRLLEPLLKNE